MKEYKPSKCQYDRRHGKWITVDMDCPLYHFDRNGGFSPLDFTMPSAWMNEARQTTQAATAKQAEAPSEAGTA